MTPLKMWLKPPRSLLVLLFLVNSEELVWRGSMLPRLQARWSALSASVFIGVFEGLFHLPLFFQPGSDQAAAGLPPRLGHLLDRSHRLYIRVARLDEDLDPLRHQAREARQPAALGDERQALVERQAFDVEGRQPRITREVEPLVADDGKRHPVSFGELDLVFEALRAQARDASPEEKPELWKTMTSEWPAYDEYQEKTDREIPVVVLEPA